MFESTFEALLGLKKKLSSSIDDAAQSLQEIERQLSDIDIQLNELRKQHPNLNNQILELRSFVASTINNLKQMLSEFERMHDKMTDIERESERRDVKRFLEFLRTPPKK